ncbi:MAG: CPBP family intramembrane metalloprotease [Bacteroidetes bacterium]|nr:CPBP family intramembrane metalloprotease [Bacteroidota bacterium]
MALSSFFILKIIDTAILKYFYDFSILSQFEINNKKTLSKFGDYAIIIIPFVGPFIEEILFRLPLNFRQTSIGLAVALITYRFTGKHLFSFDPYEIYSYIRIGIALTVFMSVSFFFPLPWLEKIKESYFKWFFYLSAVLFALVHITNLAPYNHSALFFYPLYTLPQFFMGLVIGYLRVRQGFFSGWVLHALINLPSALVYFFK